MWHLRRDRLLGLFALVAALEVQFAQAQDCSASKPCEVGCCSKFGFCGLGPDYCKPGTCVANCDRKADCDPGGYGPDYVKSTGCPLNVCCSKWGFCGFTSEFCGPKDSITRPSCNADDNTSFGRVVGYYEGWSPDRPCNKFYPEQLPIGVYTHLNFAFASINPATFEVVPASPSDRDLYKRLTNLKLKDPSLKVFIAIGGWTFNDPGPTATTFSDLAASPDAQRAFIKSLLSFMSTYNFDGVDLDWEYPEAPDRSGKGVDYANFPKFLENLKRSLSASGGRDGLSVTLPASYWYLQHFDIKKLAETVDFFNLMTYDFHGVWDKPETPSKWVVPLLNAHTNLTEIKGALDLLWRNGISSDKITMGMAFYGRAFTASSPSCLTPGCTFASGANAQLCSREVGIILNSELDQLISSRGLKPTLDTAAAVKLLTWDNDQWVAYDDGDTFALKAKFARSQCLGGLMVWAVSHDTKDAKYSQLLGTVAKRKFNAFVQRNVGNSTGEDDGYEYTAEYKQQCRWTGCNENCPSGWIRMLRKDSGARGVEYMVDEAGCGGYGQHQLCCPPSQTPPTCGWYTHNNGKCDNQCPAGTKEVGSNAKYCQMASSGAYNYHSYQAACCTTGTENMKLYDQCGWTTWPLCWSDGSCPGSKSMVASSGTGSGDAMCYAFPSPDSRRKYCCDNGDENSQWSECAWHKDLSQSGTSHPADFCHANCPQDTVRVAMDQTGCSGGSARAECCTPNIKTISKRQSSQDQEYEFYLGIFLASPYCIGANIYEHGDVLVIGRDFTVMTFNAQAFTAALVRLLFWGNPTTSQKDLWNQRILAVSRFSSLSYASLAEYLMSTQGSFIYVTLGSTQGADYIVCNLELVATTVAKLAAGGGGGGGGGNSTMTCECVRSDCCAEGDTECINFDTDSEFASKRELPISPARELDKRGKATQYTADLHDYSTGTTPPPVTKYYWVAPTYPSAGQFTSPRDNAILLEAWDFNPNCPQFRPQAVAVTPVGPVPLSGFHSEHIFERQAIRDWSENAVDGVLADKATPYMRGQVGQTVQYRVPLNFFTATLTRIVFPMAGQAAGGASYTDFRSRIMNALGSTPNRGVMALARGQLNTYKEMMWQFRDPVDNEKMEVWLYGNTRTNKAANPQEALRQIRNVLATFNFHNEATVNNNLKTVIQTIRSELRAAEAWHQAGGGGTVYARDHFDAWMKSFFVVMTANVQEWLRQHINGLELVSPNAQALIPQLRAAANSLAITQTGFYV